MADIHATIECFKSSTQGKPNKYIETVLEKEKSLSALQSSSKYHLYLAGNNKHLTQTRLTDEDCLVLYDTLKNNSYVISVDLRFNNITDEGAKHIGKLIEENTAIECLNLMCNDFGEEGAQHIAKGLHKNETLKSLRLTGNKIGNKGGMYFAQALQINTTLEGLDLCDTDQKTESLLALATVLNYNNTLKALNVNRPLVFSTQEETTVHFANMLKVNKSLKEIHLEKYDMRDFGVTRLAENLFDNFCLTYLNLSCNRLTRDGAKELAKLLKKDTPLKVLDVGYNRLGDAGALEIAKALTGFNTNLTTLVLKSNEIRGKGLCAIADCLKFSTSLTNVYIWGNELEESACIAFANLIATGRIEKENTDVDPYVVDGTTYLSELSHGLRQWYYWGPSYGDQAQTEIKTLIS